MIYLFTDFGIEGPYLGQVEAVLRRQAPGVPVINLFADVPPFDTKGAAYLLSAYTRDVEAGGVVMCVVDPGVGTARDALVVAADGRWFVGPDNGLVAIVARRARRAEAWSIVWTPPRLSATFHGRDLFAPIAGLLAAGGMAATGEKLKPVGAETVLRPQWPDDHPAIVYFDRYGNAMTGLRAAAVDRASLVWCGSRPIRHAATYATVPAGVPFWYENANGLLEIAVNQGNARESLNLVLGMAVRVSAA